MNNWVHFLISVYLFKLPIKAVYQKYEEKKNLVPLQQRKRYLKYWVEGIKHIQKSYASSATHYKSMYLTAARSRHNACKARNAPSGL